MSRERRQDSLGNPWRLAYAPHFLTFLSTLPQLLKLFYCAIWNSWSVVSKIPFVLNLFSEYLLYLLARHETWLCLEDIAFPTIFSVVAVCSHVPHIPGLRGGMGTFPCYLFLVSQTILSSSSLTASVSPSLNVRLSDCTTHLSSWLQSFASPVSFSFPLGFYVLLSVTFADSVPTLILGDFHTMSITFPIVCLSVLWLSFLQWFCFSAPQPHSPVVIHWNYVQFLHLPHSLCSPKASVQAVVLIL